jgi:hypothetical protein
MSPGSPTSWGRGVNWVLQLASRRFREHPALPESEVGDMVHIWQVRVSRSVLEPGWDFFDLKIKGLERRLIDWPTAGV